MGIQWEGACVILAPIMSSSHGIWLSISLAPDHPCKRMGRRRPSPFGWCGYATGCSTCPQMQMRLHCVNMPGVTSFCSSGISDARQVGQHGAYPVAPVAEGPRCMPPFIMGQRGPSLDYGGEQPVPRLPVDVTRYMSSTGRGDDVWWPQRLRPPPCGTGGHRHPPRGDR
ncbi:hypothetical protein PIB30_113173 [Stylosanthes scabra]|uniref:Uncharacterized protein n=1 Tax=Stylosanthes scabra TaxID=79078 RepID=A0ABU6R1X7_9FABA|nr:hypothetical protein [Stylosanthes scabra]